jgi:protoporphyrinogen oxidase
VALSVPSGQDAHWIYVPEARYPFYRVGCYSHFSPAMAPLGTSNLYVELADRAEPKLDALLPEVAAGLTEMGVISSARDIVFARLRRIDYAYVIFDHDYFPALDTIQRYLDELHIVNAGRYGGWNYSSMEDALIFGREAAAKAIALIA